MPADLPLGPSGPLELPASTKVPMERANPLLSCAIGKWLKAHGKTVKPKLSKSQKADARMCFKLMDADGSGAIDAEELGAAFRLLGLNISHREVVEMLAEVDRDGSGEVEYAEFLEIMTMQLTRLAEEQKGGGAPPPTQAAARPADEADDSGAGGASSSSCGGGGGGAGGGGGGVNMASVLPFDVVATAYRRRKLMEALEQDDKDFILSVAAADEEERERAEAEAAAAEAASAAARRLRRPSAAPVPPNGLGHDDGASTQRLRTGGGRPGSRGDGALSLQHMSHASFLDSLSKQERRIIETLSRKYRDEADVMADHDGHQRRWQQQPRGPPASRAAAPGGRGTPHLAALQRTAAEAGRMMAGGGGPHKQQALLRPASSAAVRQEDHHVQYHLTKVGAAAAAAAAAAARGSPSPPSQAALGTAASPGEGGTLGLLLSAPLFSKAGFEQPKS